MNMIKALELLQAPQQIKFNILAFESYKNRVDRKNRYADILEWFNPILKSHKFALTEENLNLKFVQEATQQAVKNMADANSKIPIFKGAQVSREKATEALTNAYLAGYSAGIAKAISDSAVTGKLREKSDAIAVVQEAIEKIRRYIDANVLVDQTGKLIVNA
jgi:hypothetical protein